MVNVKAQRYPTEKHGALRPPAACKTRYILGQRIPMQTVTSQFLCETRWFWADRTLYRCLQCEALTTHSHVPQQPSGQVFVAAAGALQLGHKSESITWILAESSHIYRPAFWQEQRIEFTATVTISVGNYSPLHPQGPCVQPATLWASSQLSRVVLWERPPACSGDQQELALRRNLCELQVPHHCLEKTMPNSTLLIRGDNS